MPHLYVSAAHKSSGKTTVAIGLCAALAARGLNVRPFKKGPDYIDPMWLTLATGHACRNLDFHTMARDEIRALFARHAATADIAVIEGNKGLHDGTAADGGDSNAALARLLGTPVVLVVDAQGMTRGVAPLLLGFQAFDRAVNVAGVILNKVAHARHEAKLRQAIETYTDLRVLGAVRRDAGIEIVERHLGLVPSNEAADAHARVAAIARRIEDQVDLDAALHLAAAAPTPPAPSGPEPVTPRSDVRIAIARDAAFGFYYPEDIEAMREEGAEIVHVDMLAAPRLPNVDGLFIGGGFPETHMFDLERNAALLAEIRAAIEGGLPVYAECGGLMLLARSISWRGETAAMAGVIPGDIVVGERPVGHGHIRLRETPAHPWGGGRPGAEVVGHEFHYSTFAALDDAGLEFAYEVTRGTGLDGRRDGIVYRNLLAGYAHLRGVGGNDWARRFVRFVRFARERATTRANR